MQTPRPYSETVAIVVEQVAAAVQQAITESGQTVQAVARGSAVPQSTLHNKLNGGRAFTVEEIAKIARYLEVPFAALAAPSVAA